MAIRSHLVERNFVARAVIQLRCPRRFVRRNHRSVFERAAILQIFGYASRPEGMATP